MLNRKCSRLWVVSDVDLGGVGGRNICDGGVGAEIFCGETDGDLYV